MCRTSARLSGSFGSELARTCIRLPYAHGCFLALSQNVPSGTERALEIEAARSAFCFLFAATGKRLRSFCQTIGEYVA